MLLYFAEIVSGFGNYMKKSLSHLTYLQYHMYGHQVSDVTTVFAIGL